MPNAQECIYDSQEEKSMLLIGVKNDQLVGVGRLTIQGSKGVISQMAITEKEQGKGIGKRVFTILLDTCKEAQLDRIVLSARETALGFYANFGFLPEGELFASKKTGIIHQNMYLPLVKK